MAAFDSATLYARAPAILASATSISQQGSQGDVLAVIAAPDLDQQLVQTKAQLLQLEAAVRQAQANADLDVSPTANVASRRPRMVKRATGHNDR